MIEAINISNDEDIELKSIYKNWTDWRWQIKNSIRDVQGLETFLGIKMDKETKDKINSTMAIFPMAITPYYLSLIDKENLESDPIFRQSVPSKDELIINEYDMQDPLSEDIDSPVPGLTHRYPDRVLLHVSNTCAMYCRHCTRKRKVGDNDYNQNKQALSGALEYIRNHSKIRDVLLSGGDPLLLSDEFLDWILTEVKKIPHVEVIRIGTRVPVVLPFRITDKLVNILKKHNPLWLNTHFNHPNEITESSKEALKKLADCGIPLGNQSVLLAGVNDCSYIMKNLVRKLVQNRVRPYYIYQCDMSNGLSHFRTTIGKGIEIMESLRGHTSGFAVPTYVVDAPGGGGKIPVMPNYIVSWSHNKVVLRNYEGVITTYNESDTYSSNSCDLKCDECNLTLSSPNIHKRKAVGIERLLSDYDKTISFSPELS
ncbi:lysine 2,3-aminomutase [Alkalibaculum sp. M08DMB]|uniref:L-lysine 2,3-aminomutase n=1 Tax=Alkalibaculum sporogenes TaxID=2655001 RepID=A0A6A7K9E3_9FIRM|nr:lysine 2,3-aminomutase [Alkalibaculum sporogenes]MPW26016.1 lysine 2,3-aminomutase [Alkalibaculum sporogenes]